MINKKLKRAPVLLSLYEAEIIVKALSEYSVNHHDKLKLGNKKEADRILVGALLRERIKEHFRD